MNSRVGWLLPAVAAGATGLAIWAGSNLALAIPAAGLATLAAGMLFAGAWLEARSRARRRPLSHRPREIFRLRHALRSGPLGREELVTTLDRIERQGPTPELPARSVEEMEGLVGLGSTDFRLYLRGRLDDLEARM
jgi:hypothetical protein